MAEKLGAGDRRKARIRRAIRKAANGRPRLSVFRSSKQIYAQIIDDERGATVVAASSLEKDMRGKLKTGANVDAAKEVGRLVAERAGQAGVKAVVFDRSGYLYHGRVKALADAAREAGLDFLSLAGEKNPFKRAGPATRASETVTWQEKQEAAAARTTATRRATANSSTASSTSTASPRW